jgi:hypothetical protein
VRRRHRTVSSGAAGTTRSRSTASALRAGLLVRGAVIFAWWTPLCSDADATQHARYHAAQASWIPIVPWTQAFLPHRDGCPSQSRAACGKQGTFGQRHGATLSWMQSARRFAGYRSWVSILATTALPSAHSAVVRRPLSDHRAHKRFDGSKGRRLHTYAVVSAQERQFVTGRCLTPA